MSLEGPEQPRLKTTCTEDDWHVEFEDGKVDLDDEEYDKGYLEDCNWECVVSRLDFVKGPVQCWVLDLLVSLFTHLPSGIDNKLYSPILWFLILYLLKKNGETPATSHLALPAPTIASVPRDGLAMPSVSPSNKKDISFIEHSHTNHGVQRSHPPINIDIQSILLHAQAEALVQCAQQSILAMEVKMFTILEDHCLVQNLLHMEKV